jgi:hypothetical protein
MATRHFTGAVRNVPLPAQIHAVAHELLLANWPAPNVFRRAMLNAHLRPRVIDAVLVELEKIRRRLMRQARDVRRENAVRS